MSVSCSGTLTSTQQPDGTFTASCSVAWVDSSFLPPLSLADGATLGTAIAVVIVGSFIWRNLFSVGP